MLPFCIVPTVPAAGAKPAHLSLDSYPSRQRTIKKFAGIEHASLRLVRLRRNRLR